MQIKTSETKVKATCDQLITWGFCCDRPAEFLVERLDSTEYAIMCGEHKNGFERLYPNENVLYHQYSLELNQKLANAADALSSRVGPGEV